MTQSKYKTIPILLKCLFIATPIGMLLAACTGLSSDNISEKDLKAARETVKVYAMKSDALKGIQTVQIAIGRDDYAKVKITDYELLKPMAVKLRMAGLKVIMITRGQSIGQDLNNVPLIEQNLMTCPTESGYTMFRLETGVYDDVILTRDMSVSTYTKIWEPIFIEQDEVRNSQVNDAILKASQKLTDKFLDDFLIQKGL